MPDPEKIVCIGLNYRKHAAEAGIDPPAAPTFFAKFRNALTPHGALVTLPPASEKVDYEAEVAFVIGRRWQPRREAEALDHVAGYMLLNDLSARDLQFATPQWMPGKVFDQSAPCGPALVTPDEAGPHDGIEIALTLNGETMQSASTQDLIFSVPALVAHLSSLMTLEPGDIVSTGTPQAWASARAARLAEGRRRSRRLLADPRPARDDSPALSLPGWRAEPGRRPRGSLLQRGVPLRPEVEPQAGDHLVGVAGIRVDRDPRPRTGLPPAQKALECSGRLRNLPPRNAKLTEPEQS